MNGKSQEKPTETKNFDTITEPTTNPVVAGC